MNDRGIESPASLRGCIVETDQTVEAMVNAATDQDDAGDDAELMAKKNQDNGILPYIEQD